MSALARGRRDESRGAAEARRIASVEPAGRRHRSELVSDLVAWRFGGTVRRGVLGVIASRRSAARLQPRRHAIADRQPTPRGASARIVRVALAEGLPQVRLTSTGTWQIFAEDGRTAVALTQPGERWVLERDGRAVRAQREDSRPVSAREATVIVRPLDHDGTIGFNGKRWRGELAITSSGDGLIVVNRLPMDDYLKGVVPLEIGTSSMSDASAVEAQAVSARSYAVTHLVGGRQFDMRATVSDQVYGGASAETSVGNASVDATSGPRAALWRPRRECAVLLDVRWQQRRAAGRLAHRRRSRTSSA